eukprot:s1356_g12.t1
MEDGMGVANEDTQSAEDQLAAVELKRQVVQLVREESAKKLKVKCGWYTERAMKETLKMAKSALKNSKVGKRKGPTTADPGTDAEQEEPPSVTPVPKKRAKAKAAKSKAKS